MSKKEITNSLIYNHLLTINKKIAEEFKKNNETKIMDEVSPLKIIDELSPLKDLVTNFMEERQSNSDESVKASVIAQQSSSNKKTPQQKKQKTPKQETPQSYKKNSTEDLESPYSGGKKGVRQFRRVDPDRGSDPHLASNKFDSNTCNQWGWKANQDLEKTSGKMFRKEKMKKKKGHYTGGFLDTEVRSIKFEE